MASKANKVIHSGYLHKLGAKVKNWKLRYMILLGNGKLHYYKKPPKSVAEEEPQGVVNVQADVIELILWDDVASKGLVKWPADAIANTGFAMRTRQGRVYIVHAESVEACDKWLDAIRSVGANIVLYEETIEALNKRTKSLSTSEAAPAAVAAAKTMAEEQSTPAQKKEDSGDSPAKYVNKVIGGMVVRMENK